MGDVRIEGCLGYSHHKLIVVLIFGKAGGGVSRTATLDFLRATFACLGDWLEECQKKRSLSDVPSG